MRRLSRAELLGLALLIGCLLMPGVQRAGADPTSPVARLSNAQTNARQLSFLVDLTGLPAESAVDTASIRVSANGHPLNAKASLQSAATSAALALPDREAILVLDTSGSMQGDRIAAAKAAALAYAKAVPADVKIGLVTFADQPHLSLAPTVDRSALAASVSHVSAAGNTSLYDAVITAVSAFPTHKPDAELRLLILSDGADNISHTSLTAAARGESTSGIGVDAVGVAVSGQQLTVLKKLTAAGSGRVLSTSGLDELTSAFVQAAQTFSREIAVTAEIPADLAGQTVAVRATVTVAGHDVTATTKVLLPAASAPASSSTAAATGAAAAASHRMATPPLLLIVLAFVGLLGICLLLLWNPRPKLARETRLEQLDSYGWAPLPAPTALLGQPAEGTVATAALSVADRLLRSDRTRSRIVTDLERAGIRMRPQEWLLLRISAVIVAIALCTVLSGSLPLGALIGAMLGWLSMFAIVKVKASRRCAAFADQLPDVLQLVASSLRSGFSLAQGLDAVAAEGNQPAAGEFGRALAEARLGAELEDALDGVADRMHSPDLSWVVMAVRISRDVGGNLAEVLLTTVHTIRERAQLKRQIRALSAEGRLSAYILIALPISVAGWFALVRPQYLRPLYTQPLGIAMLVLGVLGLVLGSWWMSRVVKVEV